MSLNNLENVFSRNLNNHPFGLPRPQEQDPNRDSFFNVGSHEIRFGRGRGSRGGRRGRGGRNDNDRSGYFVGNNNYVSLLSRVERSLNPNLEPESQR